MEVNMIDKLNRIFQHAVNTVPFYMELKAKQSVPSKIKDIDDFRALPLITKDDIIENYNSFLSEPYHFFPKSNNLIIKRTSGSTGKCLKIYWDKFDDIRSLSSLWILRRKLYGINPDDRYCYFYTTDYQLNRMVKPIDAMISKDNRNIGFSKRNWDNTRLVEIYKRLLEFDPVWIMTQPSIAILLLNCAIENEMPIINSLKYIELSGEMLSMELYHELTEKFDCMVSNQYGCNEANSIAFSCSNNILHCIHSNVFVEILREGEPVPDGEVGDIYITTLLNFAMPFIRYRIGDRGLLKNVLCSCGETNRSIELVSGRINDFIINKAGDRLPSYIFLYPIEFINEKFGNIIKQFQVVQYDIDRFIVKLVIHTSYNNWKESISEAFIKALDEYSLKDVSFEFEYSDCLFPDSDTGKLSYFHNRIRA